MKINLSEFQNSKLNVDELLNIKGGTSSSTVGTSTSCSAGDSDCTRRDCDSDGGVPKQ